VKTSVRFWLLVACVLSAPVVAHADWRAVEKVQTYAVTGKTGPELYESIGQNGPKVSVGRTIALTNFKLTWRRDYRPQSDGSCMLASAQPNLVITYTLPKPAAKLASPMKEHWDAFAEGLRRHELVHGQRIKDMVTEIVGFSVGFSAPDDPGCKKIRVELTKLLAAASQAQRQHSRDFDRVEMSDGGNVHQLILRLVNGQ
jgi:predicted secreted Zn-dependent protease